MAWFTAQLLGPYVKKGRKISAEDLLPDVFTGEARTKPRTREEAREEAKKLREELEGKQR
jgi:hypothetical protein